MQPVKHIDRFLGMVTRGSERETLRRWHIDPEALGARVAAAAAVLGPELEAYGRAISSPDMAVSLESASLLSALCVLTEPRRILDAGSGFSSYVLRRYATDHSANVVVWSVDDDDRWLEKTRGYLREQGLGESRLMSWAWFADTDERDFDLVFHDLGHARKIRLDVLPDVCRRLAPEGLIVLDDFHKRGFGHPARQVLEMSGLSVVPLRSHTLDRLGRYAALARRAA